MSDVVVHVAVGDPQTEHRFVETIDEFAKSRVEAVDMTRDEAPQIMIKTVYTGETVRKAIIFQVRQAAAAFLTLWRRRA